MTNYIPEIAKINKSDRFLTITKVLNDNDILYEVQTIPRQDALGNIIVSFNKSRSEKKLVVTAHYDNFYGTPGANDNAAACSILLNLILYVKANKVDTPLEFVFFDLEESGFIGSRYYLKENIDLLLGVYNLDMCGLGSNMVYSVDNKGEFLLPSTKKEEAVVLTKLPPGDACTFIESGIPTIYIINSTDNDLSWFRWFSGCGRQPSSIPDFGLTMHSPNDTPDTCNLTHVKKIYDFVRECIYK